MLRIPGVVVAGALLAAALPGPSPDRDPSRLRPGLLLYAAPGLPEGEVIFRSSGRPNA